MKVLFQGDSITDAGRDRKDIHNLGNGYPFYAAELIKRKYPEDDFEFINLGVSGDQTDNLVKRLKKDFIDIKPDIVSIMIGVNDTWHRANGKKWLDNEIYESNYRKVLSEIKAQTNARIMILEQYVLPDNGKDFFREDLDFKIDITRKLAREYADVFVPTDAILAKALLKYPVSQFSDDGVHPNRSGSEFIGGLYAEAFNEFMGD